MYWIKNVVKYFFKFKITNFYFNKFQNVIYSCDQSWIFNIIIASSLLQSSVSHDPSEIILICLFAQETILIIINFEKLCSIQYCGYYYYFFIERSLNMLGFIVRWETGHMTCSPAEILFSWMSLR